MGFTFGEAVKLECYFTLSLAKIFEKAIQEQDNRLAVAPPAALPKKEEAPKQESADEDLW
jgi:hypothetical protein